MQHLKVCIVKCRKRSNNFTISLAFWRILKTLSSILSCAKSMCIIMHVHWQNDAAADNNARHEIYGKCNTAAIN